MMMVTTIVRKKTKQIIIVAATMCKFIAKYSCVVGETGSVNPILNANILHQTCSIYILYIYFFY